MPVYGKPLSSAILASEFIPLEAGYEIRELRCSYTFWDCQEKKLKVNIEADLLSPESIGKSLQFDITSGNVNWRTGAVHDDGGNVRVWLNIGTPAGGVLCTQSDLINNLDSSENIVRDGSFVVFQAESARDPERGFAFQGMFSVEFHLRSREANNETFRVEQREGQCVITYRFKDFLDLLGTEFDSTDFDYLGDQWKLHLNISRTYVEDEAGCDLGVVFKKTRPPLNPGEEIQSLWATVSAIRRDNFDVAEAVRTNGYTLTGRTFEVINIHLKEREAVDVAEGFLDDGWIEFEMTLQPSADTPYQPTPHPVSESDAPAESSRENGGDEANPDTGPNAPSDAENQGADTPSDNNRSSTSRRNSLLGFFIDRLGASLSCFRPT